MVHRPAERQPDPNRRPRFNRRRLLRAGGVLGAAALLPWSLVPAAQLTPLRIGVLGPFSGPASSTGQQIRQGVLMALDDAQADNELPISIDGIPHQPEIVWVDSGSDPDKAVAAVRHAITQQKVALMVGGWHSAVALAVMDTEVPYHILHLGNLGEAQAIADRVRRSPGKYRGWFKGWPAPARLAARYGEPLRHFIERGLWRPANKRAAVMVEDSPYGRNWGDALIGSLKAAGFDPLPYDLSAPEQTDFSVLLQRYKKEQVSLVAMTSTGAASATRFVQQFRRQGLNALLLSHGLRWTGNWHQLTGDSSDYVVSMDSAMPIALWQQWWTLRYRARYQQPPSIAAAGLHYDYTRMALRIISATASLDLDSLIQTIYRTPYRGVWNRYRFTDNPALQAAAPNEVMTGSFMEGFFIPMVQLFGGEAKIIWPPKYIDQRFMPPQG
ncbi:MAG: ABC transporter substrate-binding protein [Motiliproteus sp.]